MVGPYMLLSVVLVVCYYALQQLCMSVVVVVTCRTAVHMFLVDANEWQTLLNVYIAQ